MAFGPSADPWGAGMLVGGALWCAAAVMVVARRLSRRSPDTAGGVMTLGATTFIVCGLLAVLRGQPSDPQASGQLASASLAAETRAEASPAPDVGVSARLVPPQDPAGGTGGLAEGPLDVPPVDEGVNEQDVPNEDPASKPARAAPLPEDGPERRAAIRVILRDARLVYDDEDSCTDPEKLARAWRDVAALPPQTHNLRVETVVKHLDACRRKVRWASWFAIHRDRLAARAAFAETLAARLSADHALDARVKTFGKRREHLRVTSPDVDAALVESLVTEALRDELASIGFEQLSLARPGKTWRESIEPVPEADDVAAALRPFGLDHKLTLPAR